VARGSGFSGPAVGRTQVKTGSHLIDSQIGQFTESFLAAESRNRFLKNERNGVTQTPGEIFLALRLGKTPDGGRSYFAGTSSGISFGCGLSNADVWRIYAEGSLSLFRSHKCLQKPNCFPCRIKPLHLEISRLNRPLRISSPLGVRVNTVLQPECGSDSPDRNVCLAPRNNQHRYCTPP